MECAKVSSRIAYTHGQRRASARPTSNTQGRSIMSKRLTKQELIDVVKDRVAEKRLEVSKADVEAG
jgi:hypothetical protein